MLQGCLQQALATALQAPATAQRVLVIAQQVPVTLRLLPHMGVKLPVSHPRARFTAQLRRATLLRRPRLQKRLAYLLRARFTVLPVRLVTRLRPQCSQAHLDQNLGLPALLPLHPNGHLPVQLLVRSISNGHILRLR